MAEQTDNKPAGGEGLTAWLRRTTLPAVNWLARGLLRLGLGPDMLTFLGLLVAAGSGYLAARGELLWAGVALLVGAPLDAMDGAVARLSGRASRFGALLDSTLDRYAEAFVLGGLGYYLMQIGQTTGVVLVFVTLFGSVMVSYVRARSEGLGINNKVGVATRVERLIILILGLLIGRVMIALWLLAILTQVTVIQRVWFAFRTLRGERQ